MKAGILLATQVAMFVIMTGTADSLFTSRISTVVFAVAFLLFAKCSIYIGKNSKRLLKDNSYDTEQMG
jgi:hypothetical protein